MKKNENDLLLLISHLEAVIDSLPFDVWFKDLDGNYLVVNKSLADYSKMSKQELIGINDYDIYPKEEADIYVASDKATIEGEMQGTYETDLSNGLIKESSKTPVFDDSGRLIGTTGYSRDITESKKLNDALIESEKSKAILLSNLPGVAYRGKNDSEWTMTFLSEGCFELTGYTVEELLDKRPCYYDLMPEEYRIKLFEKWKSDLLNNNISTDEYPINTASGELKWVWEQSQGVYDSEHNLVSSEGFITDITEKKLAERALKQSEERFRTMFEEAPLGIGIFDSITGDAYEVNTRYAEIICRSKEEILSKNWKQYSHPDEIAENIHKMELLNNNIIKRFSMNKRYIKPDGSIVWANITIAPFKPDEYSNQRHLCMVEDITNRKIAEEEILYLSYYDQLTGLYNRRFYEEELKRLDTERNLPITLVMADVNGLKLTNDAFGHLAGDQLLKRIAEIIRRECRSDDIVARIGGDEFIILLPKTDSSEAEKMIHRINLAISSEKVDNVICSVSFGWETKNLPSEEIRNIYMHAEDHMYRHKLSESTSMRNETIKVITETLYQKSKREQLHCKRVSGLCEAIGTALGMNTDSINELKTAGLLHDIGKIGIDEKLLDKQGKLSEMEWADIKRHPEIGYHILRSVNEFVPIAEFVLYHHERVDGKGYPRRLKGDEIPLQSKILSIADAYDAMTGKRTYRAVFSKDKAIEEIRKNTGTQFDEKIAKIFIEKCLNIEQEAASS